MSLTEEGCLFNILYSALHHAQRVALAGVELWPDDQDLRSLAVLLGEAQEGRARDEQHGPTYEERGETVAEDGAETDDDDDLDDLDEDE